MTYDDLTPGTVLRAGPRPVDAEEIMEFGRRYDSQLFHVDPAAAAKSRWGGLIASGWLTCGIAMELAVQTVLRDSGSIGSPGIEKLQWEHPVRPHDQLRLCMTVLAARISDSSAMGIVRWRWELTNQDEVRVLYLIATTLFEVPVR